jgi:urocanate hydratase
MAAQVRPCSPCRGRARGLRLRQQPARAGARRRRERCVRRPRLRARLHPELFCEGKGPFRWVALSGDPADIAVTDAPCSRRFPTTQTCARWIAWRKSASRSRACRRASAGSATASARRWASRSTSSCATGKVKAPIVIGRDHLDCGSVAAQPRDRGHEGRLRRDRRLGAAQRAGQHVAGGASWVSFHHGGGVGIGNSLHAGMVIVADGTDAARPRASSAC